MIRRGFSRSARVLAALLIVAAVPIPHLSVDDPACVPVAVPSVGQHAESEHAYQSATPYPVDGDHCAVCHWTRSLRSPKAPGDLAEIPAVQPDAVHRPGDAQVVSTVLESLPARAPPSRA